MAVDAPRSGAAVLDAVDAQRREIRQWASRSIKEIEDRCGRELRRLDRAASALDEEASDSTAQTPSAAPSPSRAQPKRRRQRRRKTGAEAAHKRREAIYRYLCEQRKPLAARHIREALRLTDFSTSSALRRLVKEGKVVRTGVGSGTRYAAKHSTRRSENTSRIDCGSSHGETVKGKILSLLEDRGSAPLNELAQALRIPVEEIRKECGALIGEEEIRMTRLNDVAVYVRQSVA